MIGKKTKKGNGVNIPNALTKRDLVKIIEERLIYIKKLEHKNEELVFQNKQLKDKLSASQTLARRLSVSQEPKRSKPRGERLKSIIDLGAAAPEYLDEHVKVAQAVSNLDTNDIQARVLVLLQSLSKYRNTMIAIREIQRSPKVSYEWIFNKLIEDAFKMVICDDVKVFLINPDGETMQQYFPEDHAKITASTLNSVKIFEDSVISHSIRVCQSTIVDLGDTHRVRRSSVDGFRGKTTLCAPIFVHDFKIPFAVVKFSSCKRNAYGFDDNALVDSLFATIGSYISNCIGKRELNSSQHRNTALIEVVNTVSSEVETENIIDKIIEVAYKVLKADRVSMFLVDTNTNELVNSVSKDAQGFRIPLGTGIAGAVAETCIDVKVDDVYDDPNFDREFDRKTNYRTKSMLCMAVVDPSGKCCAVLQAINKKDKTGIFSDDDKVVMRFIADNAGITLHKSQLILQAERERKKNESLVEVVKAVNSSNDADEVTENLVGVAYGIVGCERVSLFLVDQVQHQLVCHISKDAGKFRIPIGQGIAGYVAETGETVNISDAYSDERFDKQMDIKTGFITKHILCMAVRDKDGDVVAVIQAINKKNDNAFDEMDEYLLRAFCAEVAIVLKRAALETAFKEVVDVSGSGMFLSQFMKQSTQRKLILEEEEQDTEEKEELFILELSEKKGVATQLLTWDFDVFQYDENILMQFAVDMLNHYQLLERYSIQMNCLRNFLIQVRASYRPNPFHNFFHGIMVMQVSFIILSKTEAKTILNRLEILALLIAALCHDLDHPGTNNVYEVNSSSRLALCYNDTAVLENHHAASAFGILAQDSCNIFKNLAQDDYIDIRKSIIQGILSTDMTHHFEMTKQMQGLADSGKIFSKEVEEERQLLLNSIVHLADLSNPVLPNFDIVKEWSKRICREFNNQRILERKKRLPSTFTGDLASDRGVAKLQLGFLDYIVGPLWKAVAEVFPELKECYTNIEKNREKWEILSSGKSIEQATGQ